MDVWSGTEGINPHFSLEAEKVKIRVGWEGASCELGGRVELPTLRPTIRLAPTDPGV
jgi:hypothetical protein